MFKPLIRGCAVVLLLTTSMLATAQTEESIDEINEEARVARRSDPVKAEEIGLKARQQSQDIEYIKGWYTACNTLGLAYMQQGQFKKAVSFYKEGMTVSQEDYYAPNYANIANNLGTAYYYLAMYDSSYIHHMEARKIWEDEGDEYSTAGVYNNIGDVYQMQQDYKAALEIYTEALEISKKIDDQRGIQRATSNLSTVHRQMGNQDKALEYQEQRIAAIGTNNPKKLAKAYNDLGTIYMNKGEYDAALDYLKKALEIEMESDRKLGIYENSQVIGRVLAFQKRYSLSRTFLNRALDLGREMENKHMELSVLEDLSEVAKMEGNYKEAYESAVKSAALQKEVFNEEKTKAIENLRTQYETEKKEQANKILRQENELKAQQLEMQEHDSIVKDLQLKRQTGWIFGLGIAFVLLGGVGFLLFRQRKLQSEQQTVKLEQQLLRSQMNPHFIFNSLVSIQSFIFKNEAAEAGRYLSKFSKLMRLILENSRQELVPLEKEVQTLEHYLELQSLRFENKFDYEIEIDEEVEQELIAIPPMLAQPFIENAVEHGLRHKTERGNLKIRFSVQADQLKFEVQDDGIGREQAQTINREQRKEHQSFAIKITKERLTNLNRKNKKRPSIFNIIDLKGGNNESIGTKVAFQLPCYTL